MVSQTAILVVSVVCGSAVVLSVIFIIITVCLCKQKQSLRRISDDKPLDDIESESKDADNPEKKTSVHKASDSVTAIDAVENNNVGNTKVIQNKETIIQDESKFQMEKEIEKESYPKFVSLFTVGLHNDPQITPKKDKQSRSKSMRHPSKRKDPKIKDNSIKRNETVSLPTKPIERPRRKVGRSDSLVNTFVDKSNVAEITHEIEDSDQKKRETDSRHVVSLFRKPSRCWEDLSTELADLNNLEGSDDALINDGGDDVKNSPEQSKSKEIQSDSSTSDNMSYIVDSDNEMYFVKKSRKKMNTRDHVDDDTSSWTSEDSDSKTKKIQTKSQFKYKDDAVNVNLGDNLTKVKEFEPHNYDMPRSMLNITNQGSIIQRSQTPQIPKGSDHNKSTSLYRCKSIPSNMRLNRIPKLRSQTETTEESAQDDTSTTGSGPVVDHTGLFGSSLYSGNNYDVPLKNESMSTVENEDFNRKANYEITSSPDFEALPARERYGSAIGSNVAINEPRDNESLKADIVINEELSSEIIDGETKVMEKRHSNLELQCDAGTVTVYTSNNNSLSPECTLNFPSELQVLGNGENLGIDKPQSIIPRKYNLSSEAVLCNDDSAGEDFVKSHNHEVHKVKMFQDKAAPTDRLKPEVSLLRENATKPVAASGPRKRKYSVLRASTPIPAVDAKPKRGILKKNIEGKVHVQIKVPSENETIEGIDEMENGDQDTISLESAFSPKPSSGKHLDRISIRNELINDKADVEQVTEMDRMVTGCSLNNVAHFSIDNDDFGDKRNPTLFEHTFDTSTDSFKARCSGDDHANISNSLGTKMFETRDYPFLEPELEPLTSSTDSTMSTPGIVKTSDIVKKHLDTRETVGFQQQQSCSPTSVAPTQANLMREKTNEDIKKPEMYESQERESCSSKLKGDALPVQSRYQANNGVVSGHEMTVFVQQNETIVAEGNTFDVSVEETIHSQGTKEHPETEEESFQILFQTGTVTLADPSESVISLKPVKTDTVDKAPHFVQISQNIFQSDVKRMEHDSNEQQSTIIDKEANETLNPAELQRDSVYASMSPCEYMLEASSVEIDQKLTINGSVVSYPPQNVLTGIEEMESQIYPSSESIYKSKTETDIKSIKETTVDYDSNGGNAHWRSNVETDKESKSVNSSKPPLEKNRKTQKKKNGSGAGSLIDEQPSELAEQKVYIYEDHFKTIEPKYTKLRTITSDEGIEENQKEEMKTTDKKTDVLASFDGDIEESINEVDNVLPSIEMVSVSDKNNLSKVNSGTGEKISKEKRKNRTNRRTKSVVSYNVKESSTSRQKKRHSSYRESVSDTEHYGNPQLHTDTFNNSNIPIEYLPHDKIKTSNQLFFNQEITPTTENNANKSTSTIIDSLAANQITVFGSSIDNGSIDSFAIVSVREANPPERPRSANTIKRDRMMVTQQASLERDDTTPVGDTSIPEVITSTSGNVEKGTQEESSDTSVRSNRPRSAKNRSRQASNTNSFNSVVTEGNSGNIHGDMQSRSSSNIKGLKRNETFHSARSAEKEGRIHTKSAQFETRLKRTDTFHTTMSHDKTRHKAVPLLSGDTGLKRNELFYSNRYGNRQGQLVSVDGDGNSFDSLRGKRPDGTHHSMPSQSVSTDSRMSINGVLDSNRLTLKHNQMPQQPLSFDKLLKRNETFLNSRAETRQTVRPVIRSKSLHSKRDDPITTNSSTQYQGTVNRSRTSQGLSNLSNGSYFTPSLPVPKLTTETKQNTKDNVMQSTSHGIRNNAELPQNLTTNDMTLKENDTEERILYTEKRPTQERPQSSYGRTRGTSFKDSKNNQVSRRPTSASGHFTNRRSKLSRPKEKQGKLNSQLDDTLSDGTSSDGIEEVTVLKTPSSFPSTKINSSTFIELGQRDLTSTLSFGKSGSATFNTQKSTFSFRDSHPNQRSSTPVYEEEWQYKRGSSDEANKILSPSVNSLQNAVNSNHESQSITERIRDKLTLTFPGPRSVAVPSSVSTSSVSRTLSHANSKPKIVRSKTLGYADGNQLSRTSAVKLINKQTDSVGFSKSATTSETVDKTRDLYDSTAMMKTAERLKARNRYSHHMRSKSFHFN